MIIVLLLFFQSICLYCRDIVLYVHDRWINPKNVRLLKEAAESPGATKLLLETERIQAKQRSRKQRYAAAATSKTSTDGEVLGESCRFCVNSPQGYCRHHFHLQELELQKQKQKEQQRSSISSAWNPLAVEDKLQEYRQLRKINRELKRNLKNRFIQQQHHQQQQQPHYHPHHHHLQQQQRSTTPHQSNVTVVTEPSETTTTATAVVNDFGYYTASSTLNLSRSSTINQSSFSGFDSSSYDCSSLPTNLSASVENSISAAAQVETTYYFEEAENSSITITPAASASLPSPTSTKSSSYASLSAHSSAFL